MSTITIDPGGLVTQDPNAHKVYLFDWSPNSLALGVTITNSVFSFVALEPSTIDVALILDQPSVLAGTRTTQVRVAGGTLGQVYKVLNQIVTSESPAQTKDLWFKVWIQ